MLNLRVTDEFEVVFIMSEIIAENKNSAPEVGENVEQIRPVSRAKGWLALSPLIVFLIIYFVSSVVAKDFYKVPIASAFLVSSIYALCISKGKLSSKIETFSKGAGDKNVLLMLWIFVLAGAFASTAKEIGAIEATVNLTLRILPSNMILAGLFLASCFISMAVGTSVGTIVAIVPIASELAVQTGLNLPMITAIIVGGAFFGDNLSFISDTTIASTKTQGCSMSDKFKANIWIAAPAAVVVTIIYIVLGAQLPAGLQTEEVEFVKLIPYLLVIVLAVSGVNVLAVLSLGIVSNLIIGLVCGDFGWIGFLSAIGDGIASMGDLIIVTLLAGGMLEVIRQNGGLDFIIGGLTKTVKGKRGAGLCIACLVSIVNICTANNTIAIITSGGIAKDITKKFGLNPIKTASILDTFSCVIQGIIPYGAQMLMASGLAGVSAVAISRYLYYPLVLGLIAVLAILLDFPKKYSSCR